jgi:hypothetical protein
MRASSLSLPLLALLATGCEPLPEDPIFIHGRLLRADGASGAGTPLKVERALNTRGSLPEPNERIWNYAPHSTGTTEAEGYFTLEILSGDTYGDSYTENQFLDRRHRFRVVPPLEADGHGVFMAFLFDNDVELPPLQQWASGFAVNDGPGGRTLSFAAAPPAPELPPSGKLVEYFGPDETTPELLTPTVPEAVVLLHGEGGLVWQQMKAASPWTLSPYLLEDFAGVEAQLRAATVGLWYFEPLGGQSSGLDFIMEWRTARLPLPAGGLRPVSRGAACSPSPVQGACPFTDGKLASAETNPPGAPSEDEEDGVKSLTFTLEAPARPRRLVVRGLETVLNTFRPPNKLVLEGSPDGLTWSPLSTNSIVSFDPEDPRRWTFGAIRGTQADSPFDGPARLFYPPIFLDTALTVATPMRHFRLSAKEESQGRLVTSRLMRLVEVSLFE